MEIANILIFVSMCVIDSNRENRWYWAWFDIRFLWNNRNYGRLSETNTVTVWFFCYRVRYIDFDYHLWKQNCDSSPSNKGMVLASIACWINVSCLEREYIQDVSN